MLRQLEVRACRERPSKTKQAKDRSKGSRTRAKQAHEASNSINRNDVGAGRGAGCPANRKQCENSVPVSLALRAWMLVPALQSLYFLHINPRCHALCPVYCGLPAACQPCERQTLQATTEIKFTFLSIFWCPWRRATGQQIRLPAIPFCPVRLLQCSLGMAS